MIKSRLNKIEKMLIGDVKNYHLMAFEYPNRPEKNKYTICDGVPGSGCKEVTKEEWEAMVPKVPEDNTIKFIDDIAGCENEVKE